MLSLQRRPLAKLGWSRRFLSQSFGNGWAWLMPARKPGARAVMGCWTRCPSTQLCAVQEASALSATTHSGTSSQLGLTERGCSQKKTKEDSCYPSTLTIPAASGGVRQTCMYLYTLVHLLPLTWPSRPPRGRKPWEKQRAPVWRPLLRMRKPKQPIGTLLQHVGGKGLNFSP